MRGRLTILIVATLALWALAVLPARALWGDTMVIQAAAAAGLCLGPAILTLTGACWAEGRSPDAQLAVLVFGTLLRMGVVLAGGLTIFLLAPGFRHVGFWVWILIFYLFTLAVEVTLVLVGAPAASQRGA